VVFAHLLIVDIAMKLHVFVQANCSNYNLSFCYFVMHEKCNGDWVWRKCQLVFYRYYSGYLVASRRRRQSFQTLVGSAHSCGVLRYIHLCMLCYCSGSSWKFRSVICGPRRISWCLF